MRTHIPVIAVGVLAAVIGLSGCGGSKSTGPATSSTHSPFGLPTSLPTSAQVSIGDTINYGAAGQTTTLDCADGKTLDVGGADNTLTVTGTCKKVHVVGTGNTITLDTVSDKIELLGSNNKLTYKSGDPEVKDHGSGNTVNKG